MVSQRVKANVLLQTKFGDSVEVIEELHNQAEFFIQGRSIYGWYDVVVESWIPNTGKLKEIEEKLKQSQTKILHFETFVERVED
ncbi:MAG: hypothetical protein QG670_2023 [Thermoproteota archaeon]|nr:hypothetical protein [Thermoproteota archaeon]